MARATTRSQKAPRASQSQPKPSQSKRPRRSGNDELDEEGDESDDQGQAGAGMDEEEDREQGDAKDLKRKASDLVRLALFTEHKRVPLRREDISKKVLGSNTRAFNHVFEIAQELLRNTFGMELVELQSRAGLEQDTNLNATQDDLNEARKATGIKKKAAATGSKTYILRSILDPLIIEHAALTDEDLLEAEAADAPDEDSEDEGFGPRCYGSVISWSKADQLGPLGIQYIILALILVSGRVISDVDLRAHLKRLGLPMTGMVAFNVRSTHKSMFVEQYLGMLIRQGYLDHQQTGEGAKKGGKGKRGRVPANADDDSGATFEWRWGPRAQSEVGEKGIAQFVAEFMVGDAGEEDEEDEEDEEAGGRGKGKGSARQESAQDKLEKMLKGVERAAGRQLADLK